MMLTLAVLALGLSLLWTVFEAFANMVARQPRQAPFYGTWSFWVCWLVTAALFLYWAFQ
jgi:hypothetical protein